MTETIIFVVVVVVEKGKGGGGLRSSDLIFLVLVHFYKISGIGGGDPFPKIPPPLVEFFSQIFSSLTSLVYQVSG